MATDSTIYGVDLVKTNESNNPKIDSVSLVKMYSELSPNVFSVSLLKTFFDKKESSNSIFMFGGL